MTTLVKTNGFPSLRSAMEDLFSSDFFNRSYNATEFLPAVNIREEDDRYELEMSVPGFKKDDFEITSENGMLTISAETRTEQTEEKKNYTRKEFSSAAFSRSFMLPDNIIEDNVKASYEDGLLKIKLEKTVKGISGKKQISIE